MSRLRAPTGGAEPKTRSDSSASTSKPSAPKNPFAINGGAQGASATAEVQVERDADGKIIRVINKERKRANPLNDPLVDLDTDSEAESDDGEDAEEWGGFEGEQNEIVRQLEHEANRPVVKKPRTVSAREAEWLQSLVGRHGDDTAAMARDHKLNPMQQTGADLARRIRKWKGESSK